MHNAVTLDHPINGTARSVFEELLISGPLSRAELARRLSLSGAALTKVVRPLLETGHLHEAAAERSASAGRPSFPLDVDSGFAQFIGIKLTGDALYAVATDVRSRVLAECERTLPSHDITQVIDQIADAVAQLRSAAPRLERVGIALSGNASRQDPGIRNSPFLDWHGVELATLVSERISLPVVLENDVRAVTAAEQWFGAAAGLESFALLTLGAGIGCGMVSNGRQIDGHLGASGLIGHTRVNEHGPLCYAGHRGCAHAVATSGGITKSISTGLGGRMLSFDECVALCRDGNPIARTAFDDAGEAIGHLLALVVNLVGPQKVMIAGEGAAMFTLSEPVARARMTELIHWTATEPPVDVLEFGFNEWARGAAVVAIQEHIRQLTHVEMA